MRRTEKVTVDCLHPATYNSLCVSCGKKIAPNQQNAAPIITHGPVLHGGSSLSLSADETRSVEVAKRQALHSTRRLGLILDIDHTLLHGTPVLTLPPNELMERFSLKSIAVNIEGATPYYHLIKLRPYLMEFLESISQKYQLSIYTAGTRSYAEDVVKLIDPGGTLFRKRIVSRSDAIDSLGSAGLEKSLTRLFVGESSDLAVILDDREDVWKGSQVRTVILFTSSAITSYCCFRLCYVESAAAPGAAVCILRGCSGDQQCLRRCPILILLCAY